jgi:hypothetical protein
MKDEKIGSDDSTLVESRTGAYLEWLVNELLMTANKN